MPKASLLLLFLLGVVALLSLTTPTLAHHLNHNGHHHHKHKSPFTGRKLEENSLDNSDGKPPRGKGDKPPHHGHLLVEDVNEDSHKPPSSSCNLNDKPCPCKGDQKPMPFPEHKPVPDGRHLLAEDDHDDNEDSHKPPSSSCNLNDKPCPCKGDQKPTPFPEHKPAPDGRHLLAEDDHDDKLPNHHKGEGEKPPHEHHPPAHILAEEVVEGCRDKPPRKMNPPMPPYIPPSSN